jgi:EmrB/QacA subfamily drug resistance transporter
MNTVQDPAELLPGYATRWRALLFICISLVVVSLDNTILNVALPSISKTLGASASELQWIVDAYVLVFASLLLTVGGLGDRFGRKKSLQIGLVLFGIGSLGAGLSPNTNVLIATRAFLGIAGAAILPATLSLITATFPARERPRAIALWAAVFGLGVGIGPLIGGALLEHFEWNSVFFVNLPVITVALIGGAMTIADSKDDHAPKADIPGVILSVTGLFALIYGIIEAGQKGWTEQSVLIAFAAAVVLLVIFGWWENRNPDAMLPMRFFTNMSFTGANVALAFLNFSLFGGVFFLSQYLQTILGYSTLDAGIRTLPLALVLAVVASRSAIVSNRLGNKYTVALGIALSGAGLLFMALEFGLNTPFITIAIGEVILAVGMGLAISPATNSIMGSVPVSKAGIGSAMNDTTRQLGGALGVAILGTFANSAYISGVSVLKQQIPLIPDAAMDVIKSSIQAAHFVANDARAALFKDQILKTVDSAFVDGMTHAMFIGAIVMFAGALFALIVLPAVATRLADDEVPSSVGHPVPASGD